MRTLLTVWWLFLPLLAGAQEEMIRAQEDRLPFTLKISTLDLINPLQEAAVVHADLPFSPRWAVDMGLGAVFYSWSFIDDPGEAYRGLKWQPAIKYYVVRGNADTYFSLSYKYIDVFSDRYVQLLRQGGQYTEWHILHRRRTTNGLALLFGSQFYVGRDERCVIDFFTGIGIRRFRVTARNLPADADILRIGTGSFTFDRLPGTYQVGGPIMGLHVGWVLNKKWY